MAKEKEWKLALRARSGSQGEDWEGLVVVAKDSERAGRRRGTRRVLRYWEKKLLGLEFDHPYLKDLVNNDLIQEEEGFPALTCKLTGQRLSEGNLFCEDEGFRLRCAAMAM